MQNQPSLTRRLPRPADVTPWARLLGWLIRADSAYRQRQQLRRLSDDALRDIGLTRRQAETARR